LLVGRSAHLPVRSAVGFKSVLSAVGPIVHFGDGQAVQADAWLDLAGLALAAGLALWRRGSVHVVRVGVHGRKGTELVLRGEGHVGVDGRGGRRSVGRSCGSGVVLGSTPGKTDARVADGVALHLIDGHFRSVTLHELDEPAAFAGRDFNVGYLAESLEEGTKFILSDVAAQSANKNGSVVGVGELVHGLRLAVVSQGQAHGGHHHAVVGHDRLGVAVVLGNSSADTHGTVSTIDALHLRQCTVPLSFITETDESVSAGLARHGIRHDLGRLAGLISDLEERQEHVFGDFWSEISDKNAEFRTPVITTILKTSAAGPVQFEGTLRIRYDRAVIRQCFCRSLRRHEIHKTVSSVISSISEVKRLTYPENLSRIILTLTCSPIWYQIFLTKASSTQGSNSPILALAHLKRKSTIK